MPSLDRQLQAAEGFLELGLPHEAQEELEAVPDGQRTDLRVVVLWVEVSRALGDWERMETCAGVLCHDRPGDAYGWINLAYATRRADSLASARRVLMAAVDHFPDEPTIHFNLACYEAQLGQLDLARSRLAEAIRLQPACRQMAADDPDLAPLRET